MSMPLCESHPLTEFRRSDYDALVRHLNDRTIYERTLRIPYPYTLAHAEQWLDLVEKATERNGQALTWAIRDRAGEVIGGIGLDGLVLGESHRAEIGYWLARPFWGQGIMTAAAGAVCRHAFEVLGLARLVAHIFAFNRASGRVLEKCGFQVEGYLRQHYLKDGRYFDAKAYGRLRDPA